MKKKIISISIISAILITIGLLFGVVFCLRGQAVIIVGDSPIGVTKEEIISTAGLKNGKSIFFLNKDKATENIEKKYPYIKVVQIKTSSIQNIEIVVRKRFETYYYERSLTETSSAYYILDEELKVLNITDEKPLNLMQIDNSTNMCNSDTLVSDFVGSELQKTALKNLYIGMYSAVRVGEGDDEHYVEREEMSSIVKSISFDKGYSLTREYDILVLNTVEGAIIKIWDPTNEATRKINIGFSALKNVAVDKVTGIISVGYDLNNKETVIYDTQTPVLP